MASLGRQKKGRHGLSLGFEPHRAATGNRPPEVIQPAVGRNESRAGGIPFTERALSLIEGAPLRLQMTSKPRSGRKPTKRERTTFININKANFQALVQELTGSPTDADPRPAFPQAAASPLPSPTEGTADEQARDAYATDSPVVGSRSWAMDSAAGPCAVPDPEASTPAEAGAALQEGADTTRDQDSQGAQSLISPLSTPMSNLGGPAAGEGQGATLGDRVSGGWAAGLTGASTTGEMGRRGPAGGSGASAAALDINKSPVASSKAAHCRESRADFGQEQGAPIPPVFDLNLNLHRRETVVRQSAGSEESSDWGSSTSSFNEEDGRADSSFKRPRHDRPREQHGGDPGPSAPHLTSRAWQERAAEMPEKQQRVRHWMGLAAAGPQAGRGAMEAQEMWEGRCDLEQQQQPMLPPFNFQVASELPDQRRSPPCPSPSRCPLPEISLSQAAQVLQPSPLLETVGRASLDKGRPPSDSPDQEFQLGRISVQTAEPLSGSQAPTAAFQPHAQWMSSASRKHLRNDLSSLAEVLDPPYSPPPDTSLTLQTRSAVGHSVMPNPNMSGGCPPLRHSFSDRLAGRADPPIQPVPPSSEGQLHNPFLSRSTPPPRREPIVRCEGLSGTPSVGWHLEQAGNHMGRSLDSNQQEDNSPKLLPLFPESW